jgi:hypothetical protein
MDQLPNTPLHKNGGFKVPENYFETLEDAVLQKIAQQGAQRTAPVALRVQSNNLRFRTPLRIALAAAASVALLLGAWWIFRPASAAPIAGAELTEEELQTYITENVADFEVEQLALLEASPTSESPESPETLPADSAAKRHPAASGRDLEIEDVKHLLDDMSDSELESIL